MIAKAFLFLFAAILMATGDSSPVAINGITGVIRIAATTSGRVWIAQEDGTVRRLSHDGRIERSVSLHFLPYDIAADDRGAWVDSAANRNLVHITKDFTTRAFALGPRAEARFMTLDERGRLWFTQSSISMLSRADDRGPASFRSTLPCRFPTHIVVSRMYAYVVSDSGYVCRIERDDKKITAVQLPSSHLNSLALAPDGVYVADGANHVVWYLRNGRIAAKCALPSNAGPPFQLTTTQGGVYVTLPRAQRPTLALVHPSTCDVRMLRTDVAFEQIADGESNLWGISLPKRRLFRWKRR